MPNNRAHIGWVVGTIALVLFIGIVFSPPIDYDTKAKAIVREHLINKEELVIGKAYTYEHTKDGVTSWLTCVEVGRIVDEEYTSGLIAVVWHGNGRASKATISIDTKDTSRLARFCGRF